MKALILASGTGSRLKPFTDTTPKCLIEVQGKTLLGRIIESLLERGITEFVITTGYFAEKIETFMNIHFPQISYLLVKNEAFATTNYIYSIYVAKEQLNDDIVVIHSDLIYDPKILDPLLSEEKSAILINKNKTSTKDFQATIKNNRITKIGVGLANGYFCLPIYRFTKADFEQFRKKITEYVQDNKRNCYAEDAFNEISSTIEVLPVYYTAFAMEIDTPQDLEVANHSSNQASTRTD